MPDIVSTRTGNPPAVLTVCRAHGIDDVVLLGMGGWSAPCSPADRSSMPRLELKRLVLVALAAATVLGIFPALVEG